jgi:glutathione S-transferase
LTGCISRGAPHFLSVACRRGSSHAIDDAPSWFQTLHQQQIDVVTDLRLYSTALSPNVLRIQLALEEKGLSAERIEGAGREAASAQMPAPLRDKHLVLRHGSQWIGDPPIIAEYLEENWPMPNLLPLDPVRRAQARMWIGFADTRLYPITAQLLRATDPRVQSMALSRVNAELRTIENHGLSDGHSNGTYWFGDQFSLVDITYYPWFEQLVVLERFRGFSWPQGCRRLRRWWETVASRASVKTHGTPPQQHLERYEAALRARAALQP